MNQFYSGSLDEGAPWDPIILNTDSESDTSTDGGVMLTTNTPTSAYFSFHEGPKHNNLPPSFPSGNRIESWFKGVYGDADPCNTESCDSSTDSESTLYYDADSEMSEEDLEFTDSDSVSFTSYARSDFREWHADPGPCYYDPIFDPVMGCYCSDSDFDSYFSDSDLGSDTSETGSDTSHSFKGLWIPALAGSYTSTSDIGSYNSDSDLGSDTSESGSDTSHSFKGLWIPALAGSYISTSDMGSYNSDSDPDHYIWASDETDSLEPDSGSDASDSGLGLWSMPSCAIFHGRNIFSGAYESDPVLPSGSGYISRSNTDIYRADLASDSYSNSVVGSVSLAALQAESERLVQLWRLQRAEFRTRMQEI